MIIIFIKKGSESAVSLSLIINNTLLHFIEDEEQLLSMRRRIGPKWEDPHSHKTKVRLSSGVGNN